MTNKKNGRWKLEDAAFRLEPNYFSWSENGEPTNDDVRDWVAKLGKSGDEAGHGVAAEFGGSADYDSIWGICFPSQRVSIIIQALIVKWRIMQMPRASKEGLYVHTLIIHTAVKASTQTDRKRSIGLSFLTMMFLLPRLYPSAILTTAEDDHFPSYRKRL